MKPTPGRAPVYSPPFFSQQLSASTLCKATKADVYIRTEDFRHSRRCIVMPEPLAASTRICGGSKLSVGDTPAPVLVSIMPRVKGKLVVVLRCLLSYYDVRSRSGIHYCGKLVIWSDDCEKIATKCITKFDAQNFHQTVEIQRQ